MDTVKPNSPNHHELKRKPTSFLQSVIQSIFFGNYFYGILAIVLSIEASLQQNFPLNDWLFYIAIFAATVVYYTKAYVSETSVETNNKRLLWYRKFKNAVRISQYVLIVILVLCTVIFFIRDWETILKLTLTEWLIISIFPLVAGLYYGISNPQFGSFNLRKIGWLKPFIIGFSWAGMVTVYPILYNCIEHGVTYIPTLVGFFLFIKNFMFVTVLCIMFDIKDYAMDYNHQLKTFVVKNGLRKTIFFIIIPLCFLGLGSFVFYAVMRGFHPVKILLNVIPFILLIIVAYSLHNRRSILYYLIIIDGLMLVKAICGTIAMIYF